MIGKYLLITLTVIVAMQSETLFEVKDSANNKVFDVSTDGIAVMNLGDTIMVISTTEIKAVIDDSKALSRKFSVSTTSAKKGLYTDLFEVDLGSATMRGGADGSRYADFSPENIFLGLNTGINCNGISNVFIGNNTATSAYGGERNVFIGHNSGINCSGDDNIFIGDSTGFNSVYSSDNIFIGNNAGFFTNPDDLMTGRHNLFIGTSAGYLNQLGYWNVCLGNKAGYSNTSGSSNVLLGTYSGYSNRGSRNIFVGESSGFNNTYGSSNVFLGNYAGYNETGSNKLYIANTSTATPLIKGSFPNTDLTFTASNIYADGNLRIKGGTVIGKTQAGIYTVGTSTQTGVKTVTLTFPTAFTSVPKVIITPKCANDMAYDIFVTNVRNITTTNCLVMIYRIDVPGGSWGQNLQFNWVAWE